MKKYKLYAIDISKKFESYDCLVCASTKGEALEIGQSELPNTRINITQVKEIELNSPKVLFR